MRLQKKKFFLTVIFFACGIGAGCFCGSPAYAAGNDENLVYNFKDAKKEGTVTFTKKWKDRKQILCESITRARGKPRTGLAKE